MHEATTRPIRSTSDMLMNRKNMYHRPVLLWSFCDSGAGHKIPDLLTYLLTSRRRLKVVTLFDYRASLSRELQTVGADTWNARMPISIPPSKTIF